MRVVILINVLLNIFIGRLYSHNNMIQIHHGSHDPMALVVDPLKNDKDNIVSSQIQNYLISSGLFFSMRRGEKYLEYRQNKLAELRNNGAQIYITGALETTGHQQLYGQVDVFDVIQGKSLGTVYSSGATLRAIAQNLTNKIYELVTHLPGYFSSQILYTAHQNQGNKVKKFIAIMDYDGKNHKILSKDDDVITLAPQLSPSRRYLAFVSYAFKPAHIMVTDLKTNKTKPLLPHHPLVMTYAPSFMPNEDIIFAKSQGKGSSLWYYDGSAQKASPLTVHDDNIIDTSPSSDPKGERIVFNSNRSGSPQLYIMTLKQKYIAPLTMGPGQYFACTWSPDGQWIAFVKRWLNEFFLGIIRPDGTDERLIASDDIVDTPSWSPDSRMIMFSAQSYRGAPAKLYKIYRNGQGLTEVPIPGHGAHPCWK